jgi:hypothetical protein
MMIRPLASRASSLLFSAAGVIALGLAVGACSSSPSAQPDGGGGGSGAAGAGGGGHSGSSGSGGTGGRGGTTGNDGGMDAPSSTDAPNPLCQGVTPAFDYDTSGDAIVANFDVGSFAFGSVATNFTASGGTYATSDLTEDFSNASWHLTGTVGATTELMGLWWQCTTPAATGGCDLDLSRFKGIRFTVKGNAGPDHALWFTLGRAQNDPNAKNAMCGSCDLPADASEEGHCVGPGLDIAVPANGDTATVTVLWTDFHSGIPFDSIDPHQITGIQWRFHAPPGLDGGVVDGGGADGGGGSGGSGGGSGGSGGGSGGSGGGSGGAAAGSTGAAGGAGGAAGDTGGAGGAAGDTGGTGGVTGGGGAGAAGAGAAGTGGGSGATGTADGGSADGPSGPSYMGDITIDDIVLVPF